MSVPVGSVVLFAAYLIWKQENVLYIPVINGGKKPSENPPPFRTPGESNMKYEDVYLQSGTSPTNQVRIHGWWIPHPISSISAPTVIFCHENAGNIGWRIPEFLLMQQHLEVNLFVFDYRGYGFSEGSPSEEGLIEDTLAVLRYIDELAAQKSIARNKIFLFGRSLGGAVVTHVAVKGDQLPFRPAGVIIENSFTSIADLLDTIFPIFAFKFVKSHLLRLKWDSINAISSIQTPILLLAGERDEIVPHDHMKRLHQAIRKARFSLMVVFPDGTHNDTWLTKDPRYWSSQRDFIKKCISESSSNL
jgi:hypothetical protein